MKTTPCVFCFSHEGLLLLGAGRSLTGFLGFVRAPKKKHKRAQVEQAVRTTRLHNEIAVVLLKNGTARCNRRCAHNSPVSAMAFRTELRTAIAKGGGTALPIIWQTRVSDNRLGNLVLGWNPWIHSSCFLENFNHDPSSSSATLKFRVCPGV